MNVELVVSVFVAAIAGAALGWVLRGARKSEEKASAASLLQALQLQYDHLVQEAGAQTKANAQLRDRHLQESTARAAAQATAARVPALEAQVAQLLAAQELSRGEATKLSRAEAESSQRLLSTQQELQAAANMRDLFSDRIQVLSSELSETHQRRAALEAEALRIPGLEEALGNSQQMLEKLTTDLGVLNGEHGKIGAELAAEREQHARARDELETANAQLDTLQAAVTQLSVEKTDLSTRLEAEREQSDEKIQLLNEAKEALSDSFKALSNDALRNNNQAFLDLAKASLEKYQEGATGDLESRQQAMSQLVQPIRDSLEKVDIKLGELETERVASYSALNEQLRGLVETHLPVLRSETEKLVKALRQPTVRGRWGELQLKRVVEMAGMLDHCDFLEQENRTTEDGKLRPDLIVKLPGGRNIVVDAKAPISAYLEATEASDEVTQRACMAQHAQQVRSHITALGRKGYWEQFTPTPEFVVMFMPGEVFFSAALQEDPSLIECGVGERVISATPTTLIALLRRLPTDGARSDLRKMPRKWRGSARRSTSESAPWVSDGQKWAIGSERPWTRSTAQRAASSPG
jgi:DNA recombination protein RmuC